MSVTNALSKRLEVRVKREGAAWALAFEDGFLVDKLKKAGAVPARQTGTWVRAWPDAKYFDSDRIKRSELEHLLRAKAVLLPGLAMRLAQAEAAAVAGEARLAKEGASRKRLAAGELGLDIYGMQARLKELGFTYVDRLDDDKGG